MMAAPSGANAFIAPATVLGMSMQLHIEEDRQAHLHHGAHAFGTIGADEFQDPVSAHRHGARHARQAPLRHSSEGVSSATKIGLSLCIMFCGHSIRAFAAFRAKRFSASLQRDAFCVRLRI